MGWGNGSVAVNPRGGIGGTITGELSLPGESPEHVVGRFVGILVSPDATSRSKGRGDKQELACKPERTHPTTLKHTEQKAIREEWTVLWET